MCSLLSVVTVTLVSSHFYRLLWFPWYLHTFICWYGSLGIFTLLSVVMVPLVSSHFYLLIRFPWHLHTFIGCYGSLGIFTLFLLFSLWLHKCHLLCIQINIFIDLVCFLLLSRALVQFYLFVFPGMLWCFSVGFKW
jgi:hypothetical protein